MGETSYKVGTYLASLLGESGLSVGLALLLSHLLGEVLLADLLKSHLVLDHALDFLSLRTISRSVLKRILPASP